MQPLSAWERPGYPATPVGDRHALIASIHRLVSDRTFLVSGSPFRVGHSLTRTLQGDGMRRRMVMWVVP